AHARYRLRRWLCAKHKVKGRGTSRFPDEYLDLRLGLVKLQSRTRNFPWANACPPCPKAGCGKSACPV
ncbi:MAG: group II intron reverse transcriptase/maturase, partial [Phycisphaerae bacterium]|nr:group II intron reverse transcriptase/maturase [Phycisphaerae bacterium]